METIVDYLRREQRTFAEEPLGPPDSLVFSTIVYFDLEAAPCFSGQPSERALLHDIVALSDPAKLTSGSWLEDSDLTPSFYDRVMASRRLRDVEVGFYVHETAESVEKQFCAMTFFLPDGSAYLAFRGTDGSLAGWKEDFNLCFKEVIPSQTTAVSYLSGVASSFDGPIYAGGHSKGGNLAEYAALVCDETVYARIEGVYNHDGPSFLEDPSPRIDEERFARIYHKTVPASSIFGMLLERRRDFDIVQSNAMPVLSHAPFSWLVEGDDFVYERELLKSATVFDRTLNDWLASVTPEARERFIDTLYELFASTNATTWSEFQTNLLRNLRQLVAQGRSLDPGTKKFIARTFRIALSILRQETARSLLPGPAARRALRKELYRPQG